MGFSAIVTITCDNKDCDGALGIRAYDEVPLRAKFYAHVGTDLGYYDLPRWYPKNDAPDGWTHGPRGFFCPKCAKEN